MPKTYRAGVGTRLVNLPFRLMGRLGLGRSYRHILIVRGRKTGRLYSTPVDVIEEGGQRWLVAPYGITNWVRNARASTEVTIVRGRRSERFGIEEVGPLEAAPVLRKYLREVPVTRPYFDAGPESSDTELGAEVPGHPVFRLVPQVEVARQSRDE